MDRRSTNLIGFTHYGGDVTAQVNSSHGVRLTGGSTGGIVEAVGDDTNVSLTLRAQGTGLVNVGLAPAGGTLNLGSNIVNVGGAAGIFMQGVSTAVAVGSTGLGVFLNSSGSIIGSQSTTGIAVMQRYRIDWTVPALSSAGLDAASADSTITVTGATTNGVYIVQRRGALNSTNSTGLGINVCCSTANEIRLTSYNIGASTISGSTMSAYLLQISF